VLEIPRKKGLHEMYITDVAKQERDKYNEIWTKVPEYRLNSPGKNNVERFMREMEPDYNSSVIDLGAGACAAGKELEANGLNVWHLDITDAAKPEDVPAHRFIVSPLWSQWHPPSDVGEVFDYGFCCDVMEHIPTEYTMLCLDRIITECRVSWIQIALVEDGMGAAIGETLHLTVRPFDWWLVRLATIGKVLDARDLLETGLYVVSK